MIQVQGFKYDPEGEYVRQWLPELARMPAELIHHPWDAPPSVLKSAGVDLGVNYPNPVIDVDLARDRLTEAIAIMRSKEATGKATADEVVFDNSEPHQTLAVSKPVANNPCPATSSHDQRVPSMRNFQNVAQNRKRSTPVEDDHHVSKRDDDVCSTAESSSSSKKHATTSRNSFAVPRHCSSISTGPVQDSYSWHEEIGTDEISSKNGKIFS